MLSLTFSPIHIRKSVARSDARPLPLSCTHTGLIKPSVTGCTEGTAPCDSAVFVFLSQGPVEHMSVAFASSATAARLARLLSVQIAQSDSCHISLGAGLNECMDILGVWRTQEMQRA